MHQVIKDAANGTDGDQGEDQEGENEPGGAATSLLGGLGDAEGVDEGGGEGLEESHGAIVVPGWDGW